MNDGSPSTQALSAQGAAGHHKCILILEDDMMLALLLEDQLADLGYHTIKASRVANGARLAATASLDGAILDVNVAGEPSYPVAFALRDRHIPFVFATGYGAAGLAAEFRASPTLNKPYTYADLQRVLAAALAGEDKAE
jgi:DNA-binding response OmpR family regulator